jgi:hypothetical protein
LNREVLVTLENALRSKPLDVETLANRARTVRESAGVYVTRDDLTAMKNKGRA